MNDLTLAIIGKDPKEVARAIKAGTNVNAEDIGRAPLEYAASYGLLPIVKQLVAAGAKVRSKRGLGTALRSALDSKHAAVAIWLIGQGADVNERDSMGSSLLCHAVYTGDPKIVRAMLAAGAKATKIERPVELALRDGHRAVAQILIRAGFAAPEVPKPRSR